MILMTVMCAAHVRAQEESAAATPGLQSRSAEEADAENDISGLKPGHTDLPPAASGEYALGTSGEVIQIAIQDHRVTGYMSRLGDQTSDKGTPLTYFFRRSTLRGPQITFSTRAVHGVWYSFAGHILRGDARSEEARGAYLLQGTLTEHMREGEAEQRTHVNLPRLPEHAEQSH